MRFIKRSVLLILGGGVILFAGCGGEPAGAPPEKTPAAENASPLAGESNTGNTSAPGSMEKISTEEAGERAPFKVLVPGYLPPGTGYVETRYIIYQGQVFVVLQYEFEGRNRYFQVDQYLPSVPENELAGMQDVRIGELEGEALFQHGLTVVRWTQDGTRLMLNGAISREEAMKVAGSFK